MKTDRLLAAIRSLLPKAGRIAKGLAYPVKTYEVINDLSEVNAKDNSMQTALEGFNINIDFNRLSYTARLEAKQFLEKAISKLK